jgi:hypothetical protein
MTDYEPTPAEIALAAYLIENLRQVNQQIIDILKIGRQPRYIAIPKTYDRINLDDATFLALPLRIEEVNRPTVRSEWLRAIPIEPIENAQNYLEDPTGR